MLSLFPRRRAIGNIGALGMHVGACVGIHDANFQVSISYREVRRQFRRSVNSQEAICVRAGDFDV